jgi:hypothetical protein
MRLSDRGIGVLLVLAGASLAAAVELGIGQAAPSGGEPAAVVSGNADNWVDITGSVVATAVGPLLPPLTDEQRLLIFEDIMQIRDVPEASVLAAAAMPDSVALQDLPASVTSDIPMLQGYKFVKFYDRIVLVSPLDRSVVAVMPRYRLILD